jgi:hypothetical protein
MTDCENLACECYYSLNAVVLQEAQEEALQAAFAAYNSQAVGTGAVRSNYEKQLNADLEHQFDVQLCAVKNNL